MCYSLVFTPNSLDIATEVASRGAGLPKEDSPAFDDNYGGVDALARAIQHSKTWCQWCVGVKEACVCICGLCSTGPCEGLYHGHNRDREPPLR